MKRPLLIAIVIGLLALGGGGWLGYSFYQSNKAAYNAEELTEEDTIAGAPAKIVKESGHAILILPHGVAERMALGYAPVVGTTWQPECLALGQMEADMSTRQSLRSPIAGTLHGGAWPRVGTAFEGNQVLGTLSPRWLPAEKADWAVKRSDAAAALAQAQSEAQLAESQSAAAQLELKRCEALSAAGGLASGRALEQARATVAAALVQRTIAAQHAESAQRTAAALDAWANGEPISLALPHSGVVIENAVQEGAPVEAGQELLVAIDPTRLQARVVLPVGRLASDSWQADLIIPGMADPVRCAAPRLAYDFPASQTGVQGQAFLLAPVKAVGLSPGMIVQAKLSNPAAREKGFRIPGAAVVRFAGENFAYVRRPADQKSKDEVRLIHLAVATDRPLGDDWFVAGNLQDGDEVVVVGAAMVLSEECKDAIPAGEE